MLYIECQQIKIKREPMKQIDRQIDRYEDRQIDRQIDRYEQT